ncbi:uncharacterized protein LOC117339450 isoform X2 [Pecten maximus]|uniref:uncharacterized protein LOC117339450 isoform X2 n=1 Tax=Pecten maximus TaxID=6579 RepID=UPI001458AF63|nr:uncharacterized protein LOC117339450 isoform X2 [Pecten maximus]
MSFLNRILSSEEEHFIELVHKDIEHFLKCYTIKSVLLFPPLSSFHRLLIHKVAEDYQQLHTFSVGQGQSRRTTVCLQEDLNSCSEEGERLMSLNRPPSARGRGRGRWSSPGSLLDNKQQNRPSLGTEDRYNDGLRTEGRHRDNPRTEDRLRDGPRTEDRLRDGPRTEDRLRDGPRTEDRLRDGPRTEDRLRDGPMTEDRLRDGPRMDDRHRDGPRMDDRYRDGPRTEDRLRDGPRTENRLRDGPRMDDRYRDGPRMDDRHRDGLKADGRQEQRSPRGVDTSPLSQGVPPSRRGRGQNTRTRNKRPDVQIYVPRGRRQQQVPVNQQHVVDDAVLHPCDRDSHSSVIDKRTGNKDHRIEDDRTSDIDGRLVDRDSHSSVVDERTGNKDHGIGDGRTSDIDGRLVASDSHSSVVDERTGNKDHRTGDGRISDIDGKNGDNDTCNRDEFRTEIQSNQNTRCSQGFQAVGRNSTEQTYPQYTNPPSSKQMSQGRKSRPKLQVYIPPHQKKDNGCQPKEMSGQLHPVNCGETKHHVAGDTENVDELRAEAGSTHMKSDQHQEKNVKRVKLNNAPSKLTCEDKTKTEQNSTKALPDTHIEQCRLSNDPSCCVSNDHVPGSIVTNIHIPGPTVSDRYVPPPNVSDKCVLSPNVSDINISAPSVSDIHVANPSVSDIQVTHPNVSDMNIPAPNVSDMDIPAPNVSDMNIPAAAPNVSDMNIPAPNVSDIHVANPSISDNQVTDPDISDIQVTDPNVSNVKIPRDSQRDISYRNDHISCDLHEVCSSVTSSETATNITKVDKESRSVSKRDLLTSETNLNNTEASTAVEGESEHTPMAVITTQEVGEVDINFTENINEKVDQCKKEHASGLTNEVTMITVDQEHEEMDENSSKVVTNTHCCTTNQPEGPEHMDVDKDFCSGEEGKEEAEHYRGEEGKEEEEDEESWDKMFDDEGECLDPVAMEELTSAIGKVKIKKPIIDYLNYKPRDPDLSREDLGHVVEIYDFPPELKTEDLMSAFQQFKSKGFDIKWVDDTHALGVFNSVLAAQSALSLNHPLLKVRAMSEAARQSKEKAKRCVEFLLPYKARPETSALTARRLVTGALGLAPKVSREQRDLERQKLRQAKEKKKLMKKQKDDIWEGTYTSENVETS